MRAYRRAPDFLGNDEPALDDLLDDEVMRRMMARDGVMPEQVLAMAKRLREACA